MPKSTSNLFLESTKFCFCFQTWTCKLTKKLPNVEREKVDLISFQKNNNSVCQRMIYDAIKLAVVKLALGVINEAFYFFSLYIVECEGIKGKPRETPEIMINCEHFCRFFFFFSKSSFWFQVSFWTHVNRNPLFSEIDKFSLCQIIFR